MFVTLAAFAAAQSHRDHPNPNGRWAAPTKQLAAELLPSEWAEDAVSHTVDYILADPRYPQSVRFEGQARPTGDGFCARKTYYVSIAGGLPGKQGEARKAVAGDKIRLGACTGIFAHVNPGASLEGAKRALRWLEWAQLMARGDGPLLFALRCRDETRHSDRCAAGARAALAALPLGKTFLLTKASYGPHVWEAGVTETEPGQLLWNVEIDATPGASSIDMSWRIPAPF